LGFVNGISTSSIGPTGFTLNYTRPDSRACTLYLSSPGGSTMATSVLDNIGGSTSRAYAFTGLTSNSTYTAWILCYSPQINDGVIYTDWTSDQITKVSVVTSGLTSSTNILGGAVLRGGVH
jgi:hypothetical protein